MKSSFSQGRRHYELMGKKGLILLIGLVAVAVGTPLIIARGLHRGGHAANLHSVELPAGASVLVAGGRVRLWYACGENGREFEVVCENETRYVGGLDDEPIADVCGVTVQLLEVEEPADRPPRGKFRVTWKK